MLQGDMSVTDCGDDSNCLSVFSNKVQPGLWLMPPGPVSLQGIKPSPAKRKESKNHAAN